MLAKIIVVLAGAKRGILNLPGVKEDVGLIGVHFNGQFVELVPWNGSVSWDVAPWGRCASFLLLKHVPSSLRVVRNCQKLRVQRWQMSQLRCLSSRPLRGPP